MGVRIALAAAAVALAVAGCDSGDPSPTTVPTQASPPTSPTLTPTTSPPTTAPPTATPTPPPLPPAATQDTPTGAESFARYYISVQDFANRSGNTRLLRSLGSCKGCVAVADGIDGFYKSGGRVEDGELKVTRSDVTRLVPGKAALVSLAYDQAAGMLISSDGSRQKTPARTNNRVLVTLARRNSAWTLTNIQGLG